MLMLMLILTCTILLILIVVLLKARKRRQHKNDPPAIMILSQTAGNHSPRAFAHAIAILTTMKPTIQHVIYVCEEPFPTIDDEEQREKIHFVPIKKSIDIYANYKRTPSTLIKRIYDFAYSLYHALKTASDLPFQTRHIILNTPPILPTLLFTGCMYRSLFPYCKYLTLDIHNLAYSLMKLTTKSKLIVLIAKAVELVSIKLFVGNCWTVSNELTRYIKQTLYFEQQKHKNKQLQQQQQKEKKHQMVTTVYDKPRKEFIKARIQKEQNKISYKVMMNTIIKDSSTVIYLNDYSLSTLTDKELLIITSSSSWTPDEDFSIMLRSLIQLDNILSDSNNTPILLILTGKGPNRKSFERVIAQLKLKFIVVIFTWLPIHYYPIVLSFAKVGICLHTSSSGLDLPMKAVDLLGAGVPVIALNYFCIHELIKHGQNGLLFHDSNSLTGCLSDILLRDNKANLESTLRQGAKQYADQEENDWVTYWRNTAMPTIL